ncbi:hypothetical protein EJB05_41358, partial [Eragrostis curvula]
VSMLLGHNGKGSDIKVKPMFEGDHMWYTVTDCRMVVVPVKANGMWATYLWDFQKKKIIVLDPVLMGSPASNIKMHHEGIVTVLHEFLITCMEVYIPGFNTAGHEYDMWEKDYSINAGQPCNRVKSGLFALHYGRCFNGEEVMFELNE